MPTQAVTAVDLEQLIEDAKYPQGFCTYQTQGYCMIDLRRFEEYIDLHERSIIIAVVLGQEIIKKAQLARGNRHIILATCHSDAPLSPDCYHQLLDKISSKLVGILQCKARQL